MLYYCNEFCAKTIQVFVEFFTLQKFLVDVVQFSSSHFFFYTSNLRFFVNFGISPASIFGRVICHSVLVAISFVLIHGLHVVSLSFCGSTGWVFYTVPGRSIVLNQL